jgi:hypothetical protein
MPDTTSPSEESIDLELSVTVEEIRETTTTMMMVMILNCAA